MKRRSFLQLLAASMVSRAHAETRGPLHVVVVGAGPAGISAALELAERGVLVTLCDAAGQVGGKAKGWTELLDGVSVDVEHGVHGLAEGYVHFTDLMSRYALEPGLIDAKRSWAAIRMPSGELPLGGPGRGALLRELRHRAERFGYRSLIGPYLKGQRWVTRLDRKRARSLLGGLSVAEWYAQAHVPLTRFRLLPRITALSLYFVEPEDLDAGTFAISERWNGTKVRWMRGNPQTLFWEPLASALRAQRGKIRLNSRVHSLIIDEGRVVGVKLGEQERTWTAPVPQHVGWSAVADDEPVFLGRGADGSLAVIDGRCTHAGCAVGLVEGGFLCPCHGGRYDAEGVPVSGPPPKPLKRGRVEVEGQGDGAVATVKLGGVLEDLRSDAVILAVEPEAFSALAGELIPRSKGLKNCRHTVARFWFDHDVSPDAKPTVLLDGYRHGSNGFLLHRMQADAESWARANQGSVIEIQAFRELPEHGAKAELLDAIELDVRQIWPELAEANVLKRTLARGREFTWFYPGWHEAGVRVQTGVPGLLAAGDHLLVDRDCEFMERAVMTGRMAANEVLASHGLPTAPILPPVGREKKGNKRA